MAAPKAIEELIDKFDSDPNFYRSNYFNETEVRTQFINPFFEALGWDVYHKCYPDNRDVKEEDAIEVEGKTKNPDYSFRLFEKRKFFVEVKRPSINIESGVYPAYQIRRYAWSADLPISILTDFEEFSVYYCRSKPTKNDKPTKQRLIYFRYDQYAEKWPEIAALFSREAVLNGSLDKYVASLPQRRGDKRVDAALLEDISQWREMLAKNIALRNPELDTPSLNFSVQAIIDRIMFLRICEDRGIERYMRLKDLLNGDRVYPRLFELFHQADERYNSGIFHFKKEAGRDNPDVITPNLKVDDATLQAIIKRLYFPESPYAFSVLPAEILGQIYEQFLGQVIRLDENHNAWVEDKPEVKKAGGVKYTPVYIVENIVGNTLGQILKGKTPLEVVLITVLDPACGSGSFLIVAYQYLLDWHRDWYVQNLVPLLQSGLKPSSPEIRRMLPGVEAGKKGRKKEPELPIYQGRDGEWRLTTAERKRILLNNVYGVDIDRQAVEVTKLSLLLKVLEGENEESISKQLKLFQERALPDLSNNIKCGNSLIGWDILKDNPDLTQEEIDRINPFDWEKEFPEIFKRGGFSIVIGNPPYGASRLVIEMHYISKRFGEAAKSMDSFEVFLAKCTQLLNNDGYLSMIIPVSWLTGDSYVASRRLLTTIMYPRIAYAMPFDVFKDAYIDTTVVVFTKDKAEKCLIHYFPKKEKLTAIPDGVGTEVPISNIRNDEKKRLSILLSNQLTSLMSKMNAVKSTFGDWFDIQRGVQPYSRKKHTEEEISTRFLQSRSPLNDEFIPELQGKELSRYWVSPERNSYIRYCSKIASIRPLRMFQGERIVLRRLLTRRFRIQANIVTETMITTDNVLNIVPRIQEANPYYAIGLLNSKLISWIYVNTSMIAQKDDFPQVHISALKALPIPINSNAKHGVMVSLVNQMITLHKQLPLARTPHEQTSLQRQIEATDNQIDALVYELYGLTEEEIRIIEGR